MATMRIDGFKFNPANWSTLSASEQAVCRSHAARRERELNTFDMQARQCHGGPFAGQSIELDATAKNTAPLSVGAWAGHYQMTPQRGNEPDRLEWVGNDGGALVNTGTHNTSERSKAAKELPARGFEQLADLLGDIAGEPKPERLTIKTVENQQITMAIYTIGRTQFSIRATPENIAAFRAKLIKAKKWFSDKLLTQAKPTDTATDATSEATTAADAVAIMGASLAIGKAQSTAAQQKTTDATTTAADAIGCRELATVDACASESNAMATASAQTGRAADTPPSASAPDYSQALKTPSASASAPASVSPASFLGDIPQSLARGAFNGTSFNPEGRGDRMREGHAADLASDWEHFHAHAVKGGTLDKLPEEFARYRARIGASLRAYLASSSRCVSSFIAGPSNFPAARMNKRADIAHKRMGEYLDARETGRRAVVRNLRPDLRPIMSGDANAAERLALEVARAEALQLRMKAINAAIRKHKKAGEAAQVAAIMEHHVSEDRARQLLRPDFCGRIGFADYELTNNGANIRRMRARLETIEHNKAADITEATGADGVRLEDDPPANRVRLYFPGKPAEAVRDELKKNGFRWAPSVGAWQAYRRNWSMDLARKLAGVTAADAAPVEKLDPYAEAGADAESSADTVATAPESKTATDHATTPDASATAPTSNTEAPETLQAAPDCSAPVETTSNATEAETLRADFLAASGKAQNVKSKTGAWAAAFFPADGARFGLCFKGSDDGESFTAYATTRERMQALQALAQSTDAQDLDPRDMTADEVQALSAAQFEAMHDAMENRNDHNGALMARCLQAGRTDLATKVHMIMQEHRRMGYMPIHLEERRAAISDELRGETTTANAAHCTEAPETPPTAPNCSAPVETFQPARPANINLSTLVDQGVPLADLVGLGVIYGGDMANPRGRGAIVSAEANKWGLKVEIVLEDGRRWRAIDGHDFAASVGVRFSLDWKQHGAPYLAQLATAEATANAAKTSAQEQTQKAHAAELDRLAAEFPQLQRAADQHTGGKLAAVNVRTMLKAAHPGVKFSVTSDYNSVRVRWVDGPTEQAVNATIGRFSIGRSDSQSDYFYTVASAWSELFGGVQYLTTNREESRELLAQVLQAWAAEGHPSATPEEYRTASGPFAWREEHGEYNRRAVRQRLNDTSAPPPAPAGKKASQSKTTH